MVHFLCPRLSFLSGFGHLAVKATVTVAMKAGKEISPDAAGESSPPQLFTFIVRQSFVSVEAIVLYSLAGEAAVTAVNFLDCCWCFSSAPTTPFSGFYIQIGDQTQMLFYSFSSPWQRFVWAGPGQAENLSLGILEAARVPCDPCILSSYILLKHGRTARHISAPLLNAKVSCVSWWGARCFSPLPCRFLKVELNSLPSLAGCFYMIGRIYIYIILTLWLYAM